MSFFAILIALLLEQARPLGQDNPVHAALRGWARAVRRNLDAGQAAQGWIAWGLAVGVPTLAAAQVYRHARTGGNYMHNYLLPPAASSTPWWPSWSADGQWIAFAMDGSLWRMRVDSDTAYELAANQTYDSSPAWSPDGRWIAYTAEDSTGVALMLLNVATGESSVMMRGGMNLDPVFSPDGRRVAYRKLRPAC